MCCIVPRSSHLKQRFASESNALNHHDTTSYNHYYGDCKQEITSHRNSGFVSNVRPSLLYNCKVHAKNKPDLRSITNNNYIYTTHKDFLPYIMPSGKEFLPYLINEPLKENEDSSVFSAKIEFPDKNVKNILTPTLPRGYLLPRKTDFHIGKVKNLLHGPDTHSTTYMVDYSQIEPRRNDMFNVTIGRKEESGPTRSTSNFNPINNCFGHSFKPGQSSWKTDESTEKSVYMSDFGDFYHQNSSEPFPYWLDNSLYQKPDHYFVKNKHWPESKSHSYSYVKGLTYRFTTSPQIIS
ncbi:unnamed protein product [Schistosoma turkestanicum]|nr:unnamed protein product [Schistosoma turkestanicum]